MIRKLFTKVFGSRNDREIRQFQKSVVIINSFEEKLSRLSDLELKNKTVELKDRYAKGASLDDLLPEAFAAVREASKRALGMRHFDVQMVGGIVLHGGRISEMRTGEGKTLVATLPAFLNSLSGQGVHIITVNDYLAKRDAEWMGKIYSFLGLITGVIVSGLSRDERRLAYAADITYGTNNEFGFDYLRDNMAFRNEDRVQGNLNYAVIDEVDSILIDEARTPLIISGIVDDRSELYSVINKIIPALKKSESEDDVGDYTVDEKTKQTYLTEIGHENLEKILLQKEIIKEGQSLYDPVNIPVLHHLNAALRASSLFHKDVDYIVKDNEIIIVDEFTGRTMPGRRWSDGLHQAIEAKEDVTIQNENQTLATITYQNYFRLYNKLAGMTGTADTEAFEFQQIYGLEVLVVPTHMNMIRNDQADVIFLSAKEKYLAIVEDIVDCVERNQPVLVGTTSIEVSEYLSSILKADKVKHQVLNAKHHENEAEIIMQAGMPGKVTIATNMAGRGTDIVLGGNYEAQIKLYENPDEEFISKEKSNWQLLHNKVIEAGGLRVIGTERHESRRIDNQLRGRSGRQGDPGSSRFYLSLEDNLMRIFASERVAAIMQKLGMKDGEAIESNLVSKAIENAQRKVEAHNFDIRKHLLEYDDVANDQRKVIYEWRNELLEVDDISEDIKTMRSDVVNELLNSYIPPSSFDETWNVKGLSDAIEHEFAIKLDIQVWLDADNSLHEETLKLKIIEEIELFISEKEKSIPSDLIRRIEKDFMLDVLDRHWKEHLVAMDHLRQGIGLRSYAAKNPKQEYKREAFSMFSEMLDNLKKDVIGILSKVHVRSEEDMKPVEKQLPDVKMQFNHPNAPNALSNENHEEEQEINTPFVRQDKKVGRNEPCPCGSGKKYKQCHGRLS
ncbi:MAG: preprotein translocase subunit SecA [Gammaproteobacteria bacterium]|jgi:preprotein translocase subunit SecA